MNTRFASGSKLRADYPDPVTGKPAAKSTINNALSRCGLVSVRVKHTPLLTPAWMNLDPNTSYTFPQDGASCHY